MTRSGRTRYIPFRKIDIINLILKEGFFEDKSDKENMKRLCHLVEMIFHFEYHKMLEKMKDDYFLINPDLTESRAPQPEDLEISRNELILALKLVLNAANYDLLPNEEIEKAFQDNSFLGVKLNVDMKEYDYLAVFSRGHRKEKYVQKSLYGLIKKEVMLDVMERVLLIVTLSAGQKNNKTSRRRIEPGKTLIKLFKDVPKKDLETLLPNSRVVMSLKDKLMLGIPAVAGGIPLLVTKVYPAVIVAFLVFSAYFGFKGKVEEDQLKQAIAVFTSFGALTGYILKQWTSYRSRKYKFQKELSDHLYYHNLVNNAGVLYTIIDAAEEEECKETLLSYYFLHHMREEATAQSLDRAIENWFVEKHNCPLEFECFDALSKLERLNLLERHENGIIKVVSLEEALRRLDSIWDNYFSFHEKEL